MIDYETFVRVRNMITQEGLKPSQVSDVLGIDKRTVSKWADKKQYQPRRSGIRESKLDPYKADILRMLEKYPYTGVQIYQKIKENGFEGGRTIVQDYVKKVRPPKTRAFLKLVFLIPGTPYLFNLFLDSRDSRDTILGIPGTPYLIIDKTQIFLILLKNGTYSESSGPWISPSYYTAG